MAAVALRRHMIAIKWRIIRHGPHNERAFSLVASLSVSAAMVILSVLVNGGTVDRGWLTLAVTAIGVTWLVGPLLLPGTSPVLDPQWFRTLPMTPRSTAKALGASQPLSVGVVVTAVALSSMVVAAAPAGAIAVGVGLVAMFAQAFLLLWAGRCVSRLVSRLLRTSVGVWLTSFQMSVLLAVSFAGWVPFAAAILPDFGDGSSQAVTPEANAALPAPAQEVMLLAPTGWGLAAIYAATEHMATPVGVILPLAGLVLGGVGFRYLWIALTIRALTGFPARAFSGMTARPSGRCSRPLPLWGGPVAAVVLREIKTWWRDPHRRLGLGHSWMTPGLMLLFVLPTSWSWAAPFIGVIAALVGAMAAVNTYALDGTALWHILTAPGAIRSDVRGRQLAWFLLIGAPIIAATALVTVVVGSPWWPVATAITVAAVGISSGASVVFGLIMPGIGTDARWRITASDGAGIAAAGQWTIFASVAFTALVPVIAVAVAWPGAPAVVIVGTGALVALAGAWLLAMIAERQLQRSGAALVRAFAARDQTRLHRGITR